MIAVASGRTNQALARFGEQTAAQFLEGLGWEVLQRNWRCRWGEVDIVALEPAADTLVFVEVKCRRGLGFGHPLEAITREKAARLRTLASQWLRETGRNASAIRLDAVAVLVSGSGPEITHVRGIGAP